jgi:hypothetical protein
MLPAPTWSASDGEARLTDGPEASRNATTKHAKLIAAHTLSLHERLRATAHIVRIHGGSQSQLLRCSDGHFYVVKFPDNPQGTRTLANELICANLAARLNLPTPICKVIEVSEELIFSRKITTEWTNGTRLSQSGLCFGSRHPGNQTLILTRLPKDRFHDVENVRDLAGILLFDFWTSNLDAREILFFRRPGEWMLRAFMIDSGHCFKGAQWRLHDLRRSTPHPNPHYFSWISGIESFEPWLSRIEGFDPGVVQDAWRAIPGEWYGADLQSLQVLLRQLDATRSHLRRALEVFHRERPSDFPFWKTTRLSGERVLQSLLA